METTESFQHHAIVEVFGHEKYAGKITTETIAGTSMYRLEVPAIDGETPLPGFIKFINPTSVFSITPVTEEYALEMAKKLQKHPVNGYEHQQVIRELAGRVIEEMKLSEVQKLMARSTTYENPELGF